LSDSTNLAAAIMETDLMDHLKHMLWTTTPAYILTALVFLFLGLNYGQDGGSLSNIDTMTDFLSSHYNLGWIPMIPVIVLDVVLIMSKPPITSSFIGAAIAAIIAVVYQGAGITEALDTMYDGYVVNSGIESVDSLLTQGGITSMFNLLALFLFALGLGGLLQESGILKTFLATFFSRVNSMQTLVPTSMV